LLQNKKTEDKENCGAVWGGTCVANAAMLVLSAKVNSRVIELAVI
jgi:hypothetical protein